MKKILMLATLLLTLCLVIVACKQPAGDETGTDATGTAATGTATATERATEALTTDAQPSEEPSETATKAESTTETVTETSATEKPTDVQTDETTTDEPATEPSIYERDDSRTGFQNWSFDTFYVNGKMYFAEDGNAAGKLSEQNNTVDFGSGVAQESVMFRGWIGYAQAIAQFGYIIDGGEPVFGDFARATGDEVKAAGGEYASRFEVLVSLADLDEGSHTISPVIRLEDGKLVRVYEITVVLAKNYGKDIKNTFKSDVGSQDVDKDFKDTDLSSFFNIVYGASDPHKVLEENGQKLYVFGGINEMFANVDGRYAFTTDIRESGSASFVFVRGIHALHPQDASKVPCVINNYYETDNAGLLGGGGIYARIDGDRLTLVIKSHDAENGSGIANNVFTFTVDSTVLTFADDGNSTVYVLAGDKLITTITLTGAVSYDFFTRVEPETPFAAKAEIVTADGTVKTIENTLVAAHPTQVGVAVRPNNLKFASIAVTAFSDVTVPSEIWRPTARKNLVTGATVTASCEENDTNVAGNAIDGNEGTRWGALPKGEAYLTVDLGAVYSIDTIRVFFENTVLPWSLQVSVDGETFTTVYEGQSGGSRIEKISFDATEARYVRFRRAEDDGNDNYWFSIYEIEVYEVVG